MNFRNVDSVEKSDKYNSIIDVKYIKENYNKNHSVEHYANLCNLDKYYFIRLFGEYIGESPHLFRTKLRIEKAKELLLETDNTNGQIAELLGYSGAYYFSRIFKAHTKLSPSEFKKQYK